MNFIDRTLITLVGLFFVVNIDKSLFKNEDILGRQRIIVVSE